MRPGTVLSIRDRWENRTLLLLPRQRRQLSAQDFEVRVPTHVNIGSGGEKEAHFLRRGGPAGDLGPSRKPLGPVTDHPEAHRAERRCSPCGLYCDRKDSEADQSTPVVANIFPVSFISHERSSTFLTDDACH